MNGSQVQYFMFLRDSDESGDPLHRRQLMGPLIAGPFYMLAIYVAFSWMELFKPNKTAPLWAFFKSYPCGETRQWGIRSSRRARQMIVGAWGGGRGGPGLPPTPAFQQEPKDQMPHRSIVLQIDICKHEPPWPLRPRGPYQWDEIKKSVVVAIVLRQPAGVHVSQIPHRCQRG